MPQPPLPKEQLQEAIDLVAKWGGVTNAAKNSGYSRSTLLHRHMRACSEGLKPTEIKDYPKACAECEDDATACRR